LLDGVPEQRQLGRVQPSDRTAAVARGQVQLLWSSLLIPVKWLGCGRGATAGLRFRFGF
jgi:hypothetical protein